MSLTLPPLVDLLFQAIVKTASSARYIRRVHDGKTHEAYLTTGVWGLARQAGVDAHLVEYKSSSHPIDLENANTTGMPAANLDYQERLFVEIDGHLLGVELEYMPQPGVKVSAYQSRNDVEAAGFALHEWNTADEDGALVDVHSGMIELGQQNDLPKISAALMQAAMEKDTPLVCARAQPGVRF